MHLFIKHDVKYKHDISQTTVCFFPKCCCVLILEATTLKCQALHTLYSEDYITTSDWNNHNQNTFLIGAVVWSLFNVNQGCVKQGKVPLIIDKLLSFSKKKSFWHPISPSSHTVTVRWMTNRLSTSCEMDAALPLSLITLLTISRICATKMSHPITSCHDGNYSAH